MKYWIIRKWYKLIKKSPIDMPMIGYWKTKDHVEAKLTENEDGETIMIMKDEQYPQPGFPRGYLLFGKLSKLKHEIKNQIFNDSWAMLEDGIPDQEIIDKMKNEVFDKIFQLADELGWQYEIVPPEKMYKPIKEIYRAWTKVAPSERSLKIRDLLCWVLTEDDSYRFRVQDMAEYFNPNKWYYKLFRIDPIKLFGKAIDEITYAEVIGDMKEKQQLLKRILLMFLKDKRIKELFIAFIREVNWKKVFLSKGDRYHYRGKYVKVDRRVLEY